MANMLQRSLPSPREVLNQAIPIGLMLMFLYQLPEGIGIRWLGRMDVVTLLWAIYFLGAWGAGRALGYPGFQAFALGRAPRFRYRFLQLLLAALMAKGIALSLGARWGVYRIVPLSEAPSFLGLLMALLSTFIPSLAEDVLTRGLWWRRIPQAWDGAAFVGFSAVLFLLNHVYRLNRGPVEWIFLLVLGVTYASALVRERTLWAAVALHWGWNLSNALVDLKWEVTPLRPHAAPWISMAAHLLLIALVFGLPFRKADPQAAT